MPALQIVHGLAYVIALALIPIGGAVATARDDDIVPAWIGIIVVAIIAVIAGFVTRYWRRRPVEPGHVADYASTALFRIGLGIDPALVALLFAWLAANGWVQVIGSLASLVVLSMAQTSENDYLRHQELAIAEAEMPPEEAWGSADPAEMAPWEDEHGDHGHGLDHHH